MGMVILKVNGETDKATYFYGEIVTITGRVSASFLKRVGIAEAEVRLNRDVGLGWKWSKTVKTLSDGTFSFTDTTSVWESAEETVDLIKTNGITYTLEAVRGMLSDFKTLETVAVTD